MSCIDELQNRVITSTYSSQNTSAKSSDNATEEESFGSVMLKVLENCGNTRPEHVCCYCGCNSSEENAPVEKADKAEPAAESESVSKSSSEEVEATDSEKMSAATSFTMFIRISARITDVGAELGRQFRNTTIAFADALKADKSYNENLLTSYMEKTEEKLSAQAAELKKYMDNILAAVQSSVGGLNSALLSSSNLLGSSLSSSTNLLGSSNLLGTSNFLGSSNLLGSGSSLLSSLTSSLVSSSSSPSLAGYAATDVANVQLQSVLSGNSGYMYGIGTTLDRSGKGIYNGRSIEMIRTGDVSGTGRLGMVDTKGNITTGVAPASVEIGNSSASTVAKISSGSSTSTDNSSTKVVASNPITINASETEDKDVEVRTVSPLDEDDEFYIKALGSKNRIIDMFVDMLRKSFADKEPQHHGPVKDIEAKITVTLA